MTELSERLATHATAVRPLICMYTAVNRQTKEPGERLATDVTAVRICVYAAMSRQTRGLGERLATVITSMRPLSRVSDKMASQTISPVRGILATLTHVFAAHADVGVTELHVLVQTVLSKTREVAVDAADHEATCQRRSFVL